MKCLDTGERAQLLDLIVEAKLVHIVYARVDAKTGSIYCTIQRRKNDDGNISRTPDTPGPIPCDPSELFSE